MTNVTQAPARERRIAIVEDEIMIRMLLEDMLIDLGYSVAAGTGRLDEATVLAREGTFDAAILDVNINGQAVYPVAEILRARGVPFVFSSGYDEQGLPDSFRSHPMLQKPFQIETLGRALENALNSAPPQEA
jgi:CheY-like chemotaxis protein